jgi:hypothetical protein
LFAGFLIGAAVPFALVIQSLAIVAALSDLHLRARPLQPSRGGSGRGHRQ